MFQSIRLKDFKCYRDATARMGRLTVLVGANNAGKSTILQALLLLAQSIENPTNEALVTSGKDVDLGTGSDILRIGSEHSEFSINVSLMPNVHDEQTGDLMELTFGVPADVSGPHLISSRVSAKGNTILGISRNREGWAIEGVPQDVASVLRATNMAFLPSIDVRVAEQRAANAPQHWAHYNNVAFTLFFGWRSLLQRLWHAQPVRIDIPQYAQVGKTFDLPPESGGESFLMSLREKARRNKTVLDLINDWITKHTFMVDHLDLQTLDKAGRFVALFGREERAGALVNVANMGRGISQALPILARVLRSRAMECGIIEQPELHLHPAAQAEMADAFCEHVAADPHSQIIIETHSEHLISRIRRHVARGSLRPEDVSVLAVTRTDCESSIEQLTLDQEGNFVNWPVGFFQEGYNEALAIAKDANARRIRERKRSARSPSRR